MIGPGALVGVGVMLCVWGIRAASGTERPLDLVGAAASALGLLVAAIGGVRLVIPGFLGRRPERQRASGEPASSRCLETS